MSSNYSNFASRLNTEVYGQATTTPPKQITMEDIAKCRGSSQSIPSLMLNNLKVFFKTGGEVVTDAKIREILKNNCADKADTISNLFNGAPSISISSEKATPHVIIKDQKMAADLAEIFGRAASQISKKEPTEEKWKEMSSEAKEAHIILSARRQMEKHDPVDLLRASQFEAALGIKKEGMKESFITYMRDEGIVPKDEEGLKEAYKSFVKAMVGDASANKDTHLPILEGFMKEKPQQNYRVNLGLEYSGQVLNPKVSAIKYEKMTVENLLKPIQKTVNETKLDREIDKWSQLKQRPSGDQIIKLFQSEFEPFLEFAAKTRSASESHDFIKAYLEYNAAPNTDLKQKIIDNFVDPNGPQTINLAFGTKEAIDKGGNFDGALKEVLVLYDQVFDLDNLTKAREKFDVNLMTQGVPKKTLVDVPSPDDPFGDVRGSDGMPGMFFPKK